MSQLFGSSVFKSAALALLTTTLILGSHPATVLHASPVPIQISQNVESWEAVTRIARLVNENQDIQNLVMQVDILNKPQTSYANAIYQLFARKGDRWVQVYTSTGARLVASPAGRITLPPEVISLSEIRKQLGNEVDLSNLDLQSVVLLRYDAGGVRDQTYRIEQVQNYSAIARTTTTQLISTSTTTVTTTEVVNNSGSTVVVRPEMLTPQQGQFSLAILQRRVTVPEVIARVSLKQKKKKKFYKERFVGDFRYKTNQRAQFLKGMKAGDRVVIRLFTPQNELIGYSECELLSDNAVINLILPDQPTETRTVRTVYGIDSDKDGILNQNTQIYDYFTQVTRVSRTSWQDAVVTFLSSGQGINFNSFNLPGLPTPGLTPVYPTSFQSGYYSVVSQVYQIFSSGLAPALTATPGQLVQLISVSNTTLSVYEVSSLFTTYRKVGYTEGTIVRSDYGGSERDDDDDDDDDNDGGERRKKPRCNQGIGNGAEGCDPGNSSPRGGSNDEGGRRPGGRKK